jgi:lipoprotein-anchoring transpeptidase ErfK/SrfK
MKMGSRLTAAIAIFVVMAAAPAFARDRYIPPSSNEEMLINDPSSRDPVNAPPITTPAWRPFVAASVARVASTIPPPSTQDSAPPALVSTAPTASGATSAATAKIDGATEASAASHDGIQNASIIAPVSPGHKDTKPSERTPGSILFDQTHDDSPLDPVNWSVTVLKQRHELTVYYKGRMFKKYDAVFGRNLDNTAKQWAHDRRTPEGVYTIIEKYPSHRFRWFLRLNYPNLVDRVHYETLRVNGAVPVDGHGQAVEVGSMIGIHGTDVPVLNAGNINWTTGCISVNNGDIEDLERLLPVGTVVIIKP